MRIESNRPARGDGGGWIHRLAEPLPIIQPRGKPVELISVDWPRRARQMFTSAGATEMRNELADTLGVSVDSLERLGVGLGHDGGRRFASWPERDASATTIGIVRRFDDGQKKHMRGGHAGLYVPVDWPTTAYADLVLLPEGGSDTAALLTMGLSAIGRPSNLGGVSMLATLLHDVERDIVVLGENDQKPDRIGTVAQCPRNCPGCSWCWPGKYGAKVTAERLSALVGRLVHHRQVKGAKDARAWLLAYGADGEAFLESLVKSGRRVCDA